MPRLLELSIAIGMPAQREDLVRWRSGSPPGGSILTTSAPALAINSVAYGTLIDLSEIDHLDTGKRQVGPGFCIFRHCSILDARANARHFT